MVNKSTFILFLGAAIGLVNAQKVEEGGACSQDNNRLDPSTGNFVTDCDSTTYCSDNGTCVAKTCRHDIFPFGYNGVPFAELPPLCASDQFCPDEGDGCLPRVAQGEACQLDRDDQCIEPSNWKELAGELNINGSVCLNFVCYYANATLNEACIVENRAYEAYQPDGESFAYVWSRDNCANGMYCDGTSMQCQKDKRVGDACEANKECQSYNCVGGKCIKEAGQPRQPASWVYAVVAACIIATMAGTLLGLYMLHRKGRQERRIKLEQYETEQMAYRQSLASLSHAHQSLMALPKNTPEDVARQSLYSLDGGINGYSTALSPGDSPPGTRRQSSMAHAWGPEESNEDDVLIIPSARR